MKNPIKQFFHVPEQGKISDKIFSRRLAYMVLTIVLCMSSMAITAYAYYTSEVVAKSQIIQSTAYWCHITVKEDNEANSVFAENVMGGETKVLTLAAGTHTFEVERLDGAQTGFLVLKIGDDTYHTQQVGLGGSDSITFTLELSEDLKVSFMPHWGTSSHYTDFSKGDNGEYYIVNDETVTIPSTRSAGDSAGNSSDTPAENPAGGHTDTPTENPAGDPTGNPTDTPTGDPADTPTENPAGDPTDTPSGDSTQTQGGDPSADTGEPSETEEPEEGNRQYTVQAGDTLSEIALRYNTTVELLQAYNEIEDPEMILAGQTILIPPADYTITEPTTEPAEDSTDAQ